mgnify:FL=1
MIPVLTGIAIAAFIFAALLWSLYRAVTGFGNARLAHGAVVVLVITIMAALATGWPVALRVLGAALVLCGIGAAASDKGWSRLLPLFAAAFGLAVLRGLPFGAS